MDSGKLETLIDGFLMRNEMITPKNAKEVYNFLMPHESNWECVNIDLYRDIISAAGEACRLLDKRDEAINLLEQHIKNFKKLYPKGRNLVSDLYFQLGMCYAQERNREKAFGALIVSIKTLNEQKKSGELQRCESTFFNMMSLQEQITSQLMVEAKRSIANPYANSSLSPLFIDDSKLYEKVLEEYNDYKLALKASEETGTGA